jgi:hypothetical protein
MEVSSDGRLDPVQPFSKWYEHPSESRNFFEFELLERKQL